MPKPTATRMPWKEAVETYGEPALKAGHSHQRVSNWRRDGVPGNVLIPLARTKHNLAISRTSLLVDATRTLISVPPEVLAVIERVQLVWEYSDKGKGIGWHVLESVITRLAERPSQG